MFYGAVIPLKDMTLQQGCSSFPQYPCGKPVQLPVHNRHEKRDGMDELRTWLLNYYKWGVLFLEWRVEVQTFKLPCHLMVGCRYVQHCLYLGSLKSVLQASFSMLQYLIICLRFSAALYLNTVFWMVKWICFNMSKIWLFPTFTCSKTEVLRNFLYAD